MNDRYRLRGLENDQLLSAISALVRRENDCLSDLLAHLAELDQRELCVAMGYSSLFAYCTEELGFCKSSAGRRIAAARVCRQYPDAFARVAAGELQLSVLCVLRPHLNEQNASELFAACARRSYEQVEVLLAARFPRPDVRDLVRRLPDRAAAPAPDMGSAVMESQETESRSVTPPTEPTRAMVSQLGQPRREGPQIAVKQGAVKQGAVKPLSVDRFSVNFTADGEFRELLEEVRALLSHSEPKGELLTVMKRGLESLRGELLKKRFAVGRKSRRSRLSMKSSRVVPRASESSSMTRSRHVPAAIAREVFVRDHGRCTFCADDGRRCGERRLLQLDHVHPHAEGGEASVDNLRLRCRAHNLHTARVHFGAEYVRCELARGASERASRRGF